MGIQNLHRNITVNAPKSIVKKSWNDMKGCRPAVDISIFQYASISKDAEYVKYAEFLSGKDTTATKIVADDCGFDDDAEELKSILKITSRKKGKSSNSNSNTGTGAKTPKSNLHVHFQDEVDPSICDMSHPDHHKHVRVRNHIQYLQDMISHCDEFGIIPTFVFDGPTPECKKKTVVDRHKKEDIRLHYLRKRIRMEMMTYLECLGVAYMIAPGEAEAQAAELVKLGICDSVITNDGDALTFGAPIVWPKFAESVYSYRSTKNPKDLCITLIDLEKVLKGYEFTYEEFVHYCILCGCDYGCKVAGWGAVTALEKIRDYGNIPEALIDAGKYTQKLAAEVDIAVDAFINPLVDSAYTLAADASSAYSWSGSGHYNYKLGGVYKQKLGISR